MYDTIEDIRMIPCLDSTDEATAWEIIDEFGHLENFQALCKFIDGMGSSGGKGHSTIQDFQNAVDSYVGPISLDEYTSEVAEEMGAEYGLRELRTDLGYEHVEVLVDWMPHLFYTG